MHKLMLPLKLVVAFEFRPGHFSCWNKNKYWKKHNRQEGTLNRNDDVQNNVHSNIRGKLFRLLLWAKFLFYSQKPLFYSMSS